MTSRVRASVLAVIFLAVIAIPSLAAAQAPAAVGVKAGLNIAKLSFDDEDNDDVKTLAGLVAGLFVSKAINDNVGIRGEALFSQQGAKFEEGGESEKVKLSYVNVPLLLTAGPSSSGATRFNVFTGPQIGFNTSAKVEFDGESIDIKDDVKSTDFSWVVGVGLESGKVSADARYALGLSSIAEDSSDGKIKNRVFSVTIGVKIK